MPGLDPAALAARVRAAMAYGNLTRAEAARAMHISPGTLDRITGKRADSPRRPTAEELKRLAEACGMPFAWFWADLDRLDEIAPPDRAPALYRAGAEAADRAARDEEALRLAAGVDPAQATRPRTRRRSR